MMKDSCPRCGLTRQWQGSPAQGGRWNSVQGYGQFTERKAGLNQR